MHVGRHRHVHHLRVGKFQVIHEVDIFIDPFDFEPGIELLLLADGRNRIALVVMRGIDQRRFGQF